METNNYKYPENCYSLKRNALLRWMYKNGYSKRYMARKLGMDKEEFLWRIDSWEPFEDWRIRRLVRIMTAEAAFYVIYFHTFKQKQEVYMNVFGKELKRRFRKRRWEKSKDWQNATKRFKN